MADESYKQPSLGEIGQDPEWELCALVFDGPNAPRDLYEAGRSLDQGKYERLQMFPLQQVVDFNQRGYGEGVRPVDPGNVIYGKLSLKTLAERTNGGEDCVRPFAIVDICSEDSGGLAQQTLS
mgnify:CR=1 FL=1|jgi:hypothetical protein